MMDMYDIYDVLLTIYDIYDDPSTRPVFPKSWVPPLNLPSVGLKSSPEVAVPSFVLRPTKNPTWNIMEPKIPTWT